MIRNFLSIFELIVISVALFFPFFLGLNLITISFFFNSIIISAVLIYILFIRTDESYPLTAATIFFLLFFIVAPVLQINESQLRAVNTVQINEDLIIQANLIISVFLISVYLFYFLLNDRIFLHKEISGNLYNYSYANSFNWLILISLIIPFYSVYFMIESFGSSSINTSNSGILNLLRSKVLFLIPFIALCLLVLRTDKSFKYFKALAFILLICVVLTKNPFLDRRNALGPVYLTLFLVYLLSINFKFKNFFFHITLASLGLLFPISALATHFVLYQDENYSFSSIIQDHFIGLHYDAWSSIIATIEFVQIHGMQFGQQLLGSLLFFVPRDIWSAKPSSSATEVGNYLIDSSSLWFNNISVTLPAEGYIDYGIVGVLFFGFLFSMLIVLVERLQNSKNILSIIGGIYLSFNIFFILRGSLLPAFSYTVGALIAIFLVPRVINFFYKISNNN